ncbi:hypothetical protein OESDEN_03064 [Oesophagostomum dentatum]|uniref:ZP domain-containing protein n=1 Tax=Oesophagostomum dentatum TaxID=61180 RepID=A0A0B1TMA1_OESDE|nr:hypothetical protein OESDEN_03064 [Oesophagostomum dentatum]
MESKGFFSLPQCRLTGNATTSIRLDLPVTSVCGLRRRRVASPRGLVVDTTVVVMFHPVFMTQVDKAYHIQCNYLETNEEVTQSLDVSMQSPTELPQSSSMLDSRRAPTCRYEVLSKDQNGPPVMFATIGDVVYHRYLPVRLRKTLTAMNR